MSVCTWEVSILIFFEKEPRSCDFGTSVCVHVLYIWSNPSLSFPIFSLLNHAPASTFQREQSIPKAHITAGAWLFVEFVYCGISMWSELASTKLCASEPPHYQTVKRSLFTLSFLVSLSFTVYHIYLLWADCSLQLVLIFLFSIYIYIC